MRRAVHRAGRRRWRRWRRWRRLAATMVLLVAAGLVVVLHPWTVAAGPRTSSSTSPTSPTSAGTRSTSTAPRATTPPPITTTGTYAVGTTSFDVTVPPGATGDTGASLATEVWYPARSGSSTPVPDRAAGPYPLLAFSQGFDVGVGEYSALLTDWASAGFVVVAPTYPHTDPSDPAGLLESDIVNHPADLQVVLAATRHMAGQPGSPLFGMIDVSEVGVVGHSDGGDVSLAVADDSCCRTPGVKAVAVLSGAELASFGGTYFGGPAIPLLVVQGSADTINPPYCSVQIYDAAPAPKYYLDLVGAAHETPYVDPGTLQDVVARVTTDFFDAELKGQHTAVDAMTAAGDVPGTATLTDGGSAPPAPVGCPGAP